jgi:murein DD-endopeptidase MepM/ murein hydrolase activator NlpD
MSPFRVCTALLLALIVGLPASLFVVVPSFAASAGPGAVLAPVVLVSSRAQVGWVSGRASAALGLAPGPARFGWPVEPARVVRRFDPPPQPWLAGHRGVDLAAARGAVVHAAGAGRVVFAGQVAGRGVVSVAHDGGLRTTYEPVTVTVAAGDVVAVGAELGVLDAGHPGCPASAAPAGFPPSAPAGTAAPAPASALAPASVACLHWGLRRGDVYLDPLALLGLGRVRLLPLLGDPP